MYQSKNLQSCINYKLYFNIIEVSMVLNVGPLFIELILLIILYIYFSRDDKFLNYLFFICSVHKISLKTIFPKVMLQISKKHLSHDLFIMKFIYFYLLQIAINFILLNQAFIIIILFYYFSFVNLTRVVVNYDC